MIVFVVVVPIPFAEALVPRILLFSVGDQCQPAALEPQAVSMAVFWGSLLVRTNEFFICPAFRLFGFFLGVRPVADGYRCHPR